jgi:hypothetical protein
VKPTGLSLPMARYVDIDPALRSKQRSAWNAPVRWPAWALAALVIVVVTPGIVTFLRERQ